MRPVLTTVGSSALCAAILFTGCATDSPAGPAPVTAAPAPTSTEPPATTVADPARRFAGDPASTFATAETEPSGHNPDDIAIWVHPGNREKSLIIATEKEAGFAVYDLAGHRTQSIGEDFPGNVDLRYGFPWAGESRALVTAGYRRTNALAILVIDETTGAIEEVDGSGAQLGFEPYGNCMYRSPVDGSYYVFVNAKSGEFRQYRLDSDPAPRVTVELVRSFAVATQPEGCVADDERQVLYLGEEDAGIWQISAEPDGGTELAMVDSVANGRLTPDVEGLALYRTRDGGGYLIASSQGSHEFVLYDRLTGEYVGSFRLGAATTDAVSNTDGIEVTSSWLGRQFPDGLFVAHDALDEPGTANFKLVPWEAIAGLADPPLAIDPATPVGR